MSKLFRAIDRWPGLAALLLIAVAALALGAGNYGTSGNWKCTGACTVPSGNMEAQVTSLTLGGSGTTAVTVGGAATTTVTVGGAATTAVNLATGAAMGIAGDLTVDGGATGSTTLIIKDYDAADDDDNATVTMNCTTATTGAEDCDIVVASQTAGTATTRLDIDADGELTLSSNQSELDGTATGSTALIIKDFDAADDDDNVSLTVNCTDATTGAEDCDIALATQIAGTATDVLTVDADGAANLGAAATTSATVTTDGGVVTIDGTITSAATADLGWSIQAGANTACNTTCTSACVLGFELDAWDATSLLGCADATADTCLCAGGS